MDNTMSRGRQVVLSVLGGGDVKRGELRERADALAGETTHIRQRAALALAFGATNEQAAQMTTTALADLARQTSALAQEVAATFGGAAPQAAKAKAAPAQTLYEMVYGKSRHSDARFRRDADALLESAGRPRAKDVPKDAPLSLGPAAAFAALEKFIAQTSANARERRIEQDAAADKEMCAALSRRERIRDGLILPL